jgi:hypothetical protein
MKDEAEALEPPRRSADELLSEALKKALKNQPDLVRRVLRPLPPGRDSRKGKQNGEG